MTEVPSMESTLHFEGINIADAGTPFGHELYVQCLLTVTLAQLLHEKHYR